MKCPHNEWWPVLLVLLGGGGTSSFGWWFSDALRVKRLHEAGTGIHDITGRARRTYSDLPGSNDTE
jgi:hypothetical protein